MGWPIQTRVVMVGTDSSGKYDTAFEMGWKI